MIAKVCMFPLGLPKLEPMPGSRNYLVLEDFAYVRPSGLRILVPADFTTDGASIPRFLWRLVGDPFAPDYLCAALVHDWLWRNAFTWERKGAANDVFAEILQRQGVVGCVKRCELEAGVWLGKIGWWVSEWCLTRFACRTER